MDKLLCESLEEYREKNLFHEIDDILNEADEHGMVGGLYKAVKTYPGRVLRKVRTRGIMKKYQKKLMDKISAIPPKYVPNLNKLIEKTQKRLDAIDPGESDERQRNQKIDILDDLKDYMKELLNKLKAAMDNQLKIYDDALHARLDRPGTITGVEFYPEEKTALLSEWQAVQDQVTDFIHSQLINMMDNAFISKFQEIKAELEEFINSRDKWRSAYDKEEFDESKIKDPTQKQIYDILKTTGFEPKTPYKILKRDAFEEPAPVNSFFLYNADANGNIFYWFATVNSKGAYIMVPQSKQYFTRQGDTGGEWKQRIFDVQKGGVQPPPAPAPAPKP